MSRTSRQSTPWRTAVAGPAVLAAVLVAAASAATPALALPEGRHYEMVSPPYKGGYGVTRLEGVAMEGAGEGERVVFLSVGTFAGAPSSDLFNTYLARRGGAGWSTEPMMVPATIAPAAFLAELSPTLDSALFFGYPGTSGGAAEGETLEPEFLFHPLDTAGAGFLVAGMPLKRVDGKRLHGVGTSGASPRFCHALLRTGVSTAEGEPLLAETTASENDLYDVTTGAPGCRGQFSVRLVGVKNSLGPNEEPRVLDPPCLVSAGAQVATPGNGFNSIAAEGEVIFFQTAPTHSGATCGLNNVNPVQLYVRLGGSRTLEISRPLEASKPFGGCGDGGNPGEVPGEVPCPGAATRAGAVFQGANQAGTRVFFTTAQSLVAGDTDTGTDLYMASIGCPAGEPGCEPAEREVTSLVQVSADPNAGEAAGFQGITDVSPDGARAYFVARGVLSAANAEGHPPVAGADNLYVYDAEDGTVHFIADLCSGPTESGVTQDLSCPSDLAAGGKGVPGERNDIGVWGESREVQTAGPDGRFLLFSSFAQLLPGDTDTTKDLYRYDAQSGRLDRVSVGEEGHDANGNNNAFNVEIPALRQNEQAQEDYNLTSRAISEDGSRVVFATAEPLSQFAGNHLVNAYEWHKEPGWGEGRVSLVSNGHDEEPVGGQPIGGQRSEVVITPSGRDIFFRTVQGLVPQDTDGAVDVYDARLGAGFPPAPVQRRECWGEACRGPLTNPAPLLVPGSVLQAPGEGFAAPAPATAAAKKATKRCPKARRPSHGKCVKAKAKKRNTKARRAAAHRRPGR